MKRNQLTVSFVRGVTRPGKYGDGYGLMLVVQPTGSKSWIQRLVVHGKRRDLGLGPLDRVSLAQARKRAFENRNIAREGGDPAMGRSGVPTLAGAMESTIKVHAATWKATSKNEAQFRSMFGAYVLPRFGGRPVNSITAADVLAILAPLQAEKAETARKLRQRLGMVFKWAVTQGHRADDPTAAIGAALPKRGKTTEHHRALPFAEVATAIDTIRASKAWPATKLVIEFLALTAARSGEVRAATWAEVDFEGRTWTVPAARTKTGAAHRVPLSGRALAILEAARELSDGAPGSLIFPSMRGRVLSDNALSKLMRERKIDAVPHGLRASFRDWCGAMGVDREVAEAALAHSRPGVEAAYHRADLLGRRAEVMARWAAYLAAPPGRVVSIRASA